MIAAHRDGTALQVKLFPDIGPSDVHFWDDGDCQAGIEQLQLEDRGQFSDASTLCIFPHFGRECNQLNLLEFPFG